MDWIEIELPSSCYSKYIMSIICCMMYGPIAIMHDTSPSSLLASVMKLAVVWRLHTTSYEPRRLLRLVIRYHLLEIYNELYMLLQQAPCFSRMYYVCQRTVNSHGVVYGPTLYRNEHELYVLLFLMYRHIIRNMIILSISIHTKITL